MLYAGYFGRAPDREGFDFWLGQTNAGADIAGIAHSFSLSDEYLSLYGGLNNGGLIDAIYANLFDRAPDADGKAYWLAQLDSGTSPGRLIVDVMSGAQGNDRLIIENAAIVAQDWTSRAPAAFDIAAAREAITSINERQPVTGNGITVNITDVALLPWQNQIDATIKAAWHQWEIHFTNNSQIQIDVGYAPLPGAGLYASAAPRMELVTSSGYTQSGVAQEIITGMDPNGSAPDGFINLHMDPAEIFSLQTATAIFAHEIGHFFYRTQIMNANATAITNYDSFISASGGSLHFDGPNTMQAYGGPVPVSRIGSFNDFAHFDDGLLLMYPYFGAYDVRSVGVVDLAVLTDLGIGIA